LVNVFSHVKEALVRLPNTRKCIEKGVREIVNDTLRLLWSRRMRNMLVHYNVLEDNEHINFLQKIIGITHSVDSKKARTSVLR
jgi:hypothetical protein